MCGHASSGRSPTCMCCWPPTCMCCWPCCWPCSVYGGFHSWIFSCFRRFFSLASKFCSAIVLRGYKIKTVTSASQVHEDLFKPLDRVRGQQLLTSGSVSVKLRPLMVASDHYRKCSCNNLFPNFQLKLRLVIINHSVLSHRAPAAWREM